MMKKHTFIGDERVLARWVNEFPDLINFISDFIEINHLLESEDSTLLSEILHNPINADNTIVVASNNDIVFDALKNKFAAFSDIFVNICDFVSQQLTDSQLMPSQIRIDASTICQLKCKSCYMRLNNSGTMGSGYLSFDNFKKIIESSPFVNEVELSNSGEIFLNPDLVKIMEYAYANNIKLTAFNGVNFNRVTDVQLEALVKYQFYGLMISIDGASQDTYSKYRINGNFDVVIKNIKKLTEYKKHYNSNYPIMIWQYIIMESSELDVPLAKIKAEELNIPIWFKLAWDNNYKTENADMLKKETGLQALTRNEYLEKMNKVYLGTACSHMFIAPQINWDGRLLGCWNVFTDDYQVNVFEMGLRKALQSQKFINAKKYLLHPSEAETKDFPCFNCEKSFQRKTISEKLLPFEDICKRLKTRPSWIHSPKELP